MARQVKKPGKAARVAKDEVLHLRITAEQKARLSAAAEAAKRSLSDWVRLALDELATRERKP